MVYLKATVTGFVGAFLFAVVWFMGAMLLPILWQMWSQRGQGAGIGAAWVGSGSILLAAIIGFVISFAWAVRRS